MNDPISTPTPSAGIASEMSNDQFIARLLAASTAIYLAADKPVADSIAELLQEAALRLTPDRPKGGGEEDAVTIGVLRGEVKDLTHKLWELHATVHIVCTECGIPSQVTWGEDVYGNEEFRQVSDAHRLGQLHKKFIAMSAPSAPPDAATVEACEREIDGVIAAGMLGAKTPRGTIAEILTRHLRAQPVKEDDKT